MPRRRPLTPLEDASLRAVVNTQHEADGWLDLTRISSRTGRHLHDVRQAVARLARFGLVEIAETAADNERWVRFVLPEADESEAPETA